MPYWFGGSLCMLMRLAKHRLVKDSLVLFGVQISGYVLPLITLPYLTRVLGPDRFGLLALGTAIAVYFCMAVEWGFSVTGPRKIAVVQDQPEAVARIYSTIMACRMVFVLASFVILCALLWLVPSFWPYRALYLISFLQVLGWGLTPNWLMQGMQQIRLVAYSDYGAKIVFVALIFLLVRKESDYLIAAALQAGGFLMSACIGLVVSFRIFKIRLVKPSRQEMWAATKEAWPVFLSAASMTVVTSTNMLILKSATGNSQVGFFSAAQRLVIAMRALSNPINAAVFPHMSKLAAESPERGLEFLRKRLIWTILPFVALSLGMFLLAPMASNILYGSKYEETGVLLRLMSLTPFLHALSMCLGVYYMLAFGYEKAMSRIIQGAAVFNFVALGILLQLTSPVRAIALGTTLVDAFIATSSIVFYYRSTRKGWKKS